MKSRRVVFAVLVLSLLASNIGAWPNCEACITGDDGQTYCKPDEIILSFWPRVSPCEAVYYCNAGWPPYCYWICSGSLCLMV